MKAPTITKLECAACTAPITGTPDILGGRINLVKCAYCGTTNVIDLPQQRQQDNGINITVRGDVTGNIIVGNNIVKNG